MDSANKFGFFKKGFFGILILVLLVLFWPFVIVPAGTRGVVLQWGAVSGKVWNEGLHFRIPIAQQVVILRVQTVKFDVSTSAYSKDTQTVTANVALNYHVNPESVNALYQKIGIGYQENVIAPAIQEAVKTATAKFTAQELIDQRPLVKDEIKAILNDRLTTNNLILDEFSVTDFSFTDEYERAIEQKQVAQQNALAAENKLKQTRIEADARVAQAEGEAKAIKIQAEAVTQQGGEDYVRLQWVSKWNGIMPTTVLGDAVPMVNIK